MINIFTKTTYLYVFLWCSGLFFVLLYGIINTFTILLLVLKTIHNKGDFFIMPNRISVTIAGQQYTILAEENEEYTRQVALRADNKIREAREVTEASPLNAAVLAALNLADEATKAEREVRRAKGEIAEREEQIKAIREEMMRIVQENADLRNQLQAKAGMKFESASEPEKSEQDKAEQTETDSQPKQEEKTEQKPEENKKSDEKVKAEKK